MDRTTKGIARRTLLGASLALPLAGILRAAEPDLSPLRDITTDAVPIDAAERARRLSRAQGYMRTLGMRAVVIEPGASLNYFTGIRWGRSERLTAAVIPVEGDPLVVTPFFEEPSVRQTLAVPADVRVWQEDQEPLHLVIDWLIRKRLHKGVIGIERTARSFVWNGLANGLRDSTLILADRVVQNCRMLKSPAEIALMQKATDVTVAAYRWTQPRVEKGMTGADIGALMNAATRNLGGEPEFALALIGPAAALPHGSREVFRVADGQVVLMDCGCTVDGYQSDVSRTWVHGTAAKPQRTVWDHVARGQQRAFATARIGTPAGAVDDAVRRLYETLGYGPGYRLPGLSHRTGHGIGMEGHEPINLVHGETMALAAGMCFSNEPGVYLPGRFGVRLEDCFHMTPVGPRWFSEPPRSIDAPV